MPKRHPTQITPLSLSAPPRPTQQSGCRCRARVGREVGKQSDVRWPSKDPNDYVDPPAVRDPATWRRDYAVVVLLVIVGLVLVLTVSPWAASLPFFGAAAGVAARAH